MSLNHSNPILPTLACSSRHSNRNVQLKVNNEFVYNNVHLKRNPRTQFLFEKKWEFTIELTVFAQY